MERMTTGGKSSTGLYTYRGKSKRRTKDDGKRILRLVQVLSGLIRKCRKDMKIRGRHFLITGGGRFK
jgi:hypothetical protein